VREGYEKGIHGLEYLLDKLRAQVSSRGYIRALDGGKLYSRSDHSVLNLQLQSDGALVMKSALIFADQLLAEAGLTEGLDFKYVGNCHDEVILTAKPEYADVAGQALVDGMRMSGEWFGFPLPITAEYHIGNSWGETH